MMMLINVQIMIFWVIKQLDVARKPPLDVDLVIGAGVQKSDNWGGGDVLGTLSRRRLKFEGTQKTCSFVNKKVFTFLCCLPAKKRKS